MPCSVLHVHSGKSSSSHLSIWRSRPVRSTTTVSAGKGKDRGHWASMAYLRKAWGEEGVEGKQGCVRFASGFLRPSSNSTHRLTPPEISTEPAGCGQRQANLSGQDIGRRLHMLLQGGRVEQHIAQVATGRHRSAGGEGREAGEGGLGVLF